MFLKYHGKIKKYENGLHTGHAENGGERMAKEALEKVRQAEEKAREITKEASQKSRDIRRDAEARADERYKEIMNMAARETEALREKARLEGEQEAKPILESGKAKAGELSALDDKVLEDAVNIILERIVKADGNR